MSNYTVRIEGSEKVRSITCPDCDETFEVRRPMPARGKWPVRCTSCADSRHLEKKRDLQRKVRSGKHNPSYAASRPLWNRSDHWGPGSRTTMNNAASINLTRTALTDDTLEETDAVDALHDVLTEKDKSRTPDVKMAPAYTGSDEDDQIKRALINQDADTSFFLPGGPQVGRSNPSIPTPVMDEEARAWLRDHPDWHREERTDDGGWGCRPGQYADPDHLEEDELRFVLGIELEDDDDDLMREIARERDEEIDRLLKLSA